MSGHVADRIADAGGALAVGAPLVATVAEWNVYLQAGAFIVAIISGLCAAYYYLRKAHRNEDK